ncbi:MAG TPA: sugar ABC transporter permease [Petrotogaceae bacterium]|nr:sugar ABC transporter permease [Petrotogaceae bacterium]
MKFPAEILIGIISVFIVLILLLSKKIVKPFLKPRNWRKYSESVTAYLYLLPSFVVLGIFVFYPIVYSFVLSFFKWDFKNQQNPMFNGLENYQKLFTLRNGIEASFNTAFFNTVLVVMTFIFLMHVIFDLKKIKDKKYTKLMFVMTAVGLAFVIFGRFVPMVVIIVVSIAMLCVYTVLAAMKFIEGSSDRLMGRLILFFVFYFACFKIGIPEIINYLSLAKEQSDFIKSIWNTSHYVILSTPITIFLALIIALLLNKSVKGKSFFRTLYFIPFVTSVVAVSLVFQWIFNDNGLLNYFLSFFGVERIQWLKNENWTIPTVAIISVWKLIGYYAVIFLSGLQSIDKSYYEAADVDGASGWQKLKYITWPLLSPTTFFILIVSMIGAFKVFSEIFVLYSGLPGPYNNSGLTVVYYVYDKFYNEQRMGEASAAAYVLFGIILLFTFVQMAAGKNKVHYDS